MTRTIQDLQMLQALPLNLKISMTKARIRQWVNEFGEDGVYVSFSGGKDSTVLLHLVREMYPRVPAVFCDTGLEYPEIREFVKTFDNVVWLRPKMNFRQVIEKYGYPFISKEVSECVYGARKYLTAVIERESLDRQTDRQPPYAYSYQRLVGTGEFCRDRQIWEAVKSCKIGGGGSARDFANLTGNRTTQGVDARLWKGYRQFSSAEAVGNTSEAGQSDSGEPP